MVPAVFIWSQLNNPYFKPIEFDGFNPDFNTLDLDGIYKDWVYGIKLVEFDQSRI